MERCTATSKSTGKTCGKPAVKGYSVCNIHGAGTPSRKTRGGRPLKSGRYSKLKTEELRTMIDRHQRDPDPLNTLPEIAAARAVFEDFINRYEEHSAALIAWHESFGKEDANPKPTQILDIADAYRILDTITKMVERREKADNRNALSRDEFIRIVTEMGRMVNLYVEDEKIREKIKDAWSSIHVA